MVDSLAWDKTFDEIRVVGLVSSKVTICKGH